jgi:hypothetical protein
VKNPTTWTPSDFDTWECGEGIGVVLPDQPDADIGMVDVQWPRGRATHRIEELLKVDAAVDAMPPIGTFQHGR